MDWFKTVITIAAVALAAGCINGGGETQSEGDRAITINELSVTPATITEGSSATAVLRATNTGRLQANLRAGEVGGNVLRDYCRDIFCIPGYDCQGDEGGSGILEGYETSGPEADEDGNYSVSPGQTISFRWNLDTRDANVPLYGQTCNLRFEIPFDYSVEAFRQVQLLSNDNVEPSTVESRSSAGPLKFDIQTVGGTQHPSTYIVGDHDRGRITLQLINQGQEGYDKGVIDVDEESLRIQAGDGPDSPIYIDERFETIDPGEDFTVADCVEDAEGRLSRVYSYCIQKVQEDDSGEVEQTTLGWTADGYDEPKCDIDGDGALRMFEGESRMVVCDVDLPDEIDSPGEIYDVTASVDYTYKEQLSTRSVEVEPRVQ